MCQKTVKVTLVYSTRPEMRALVIYERILIEERKPRVIKRKPARLKCRITFTFE